MEHSADNTPEHPVVDNNVVDKTRSASRQQSSAEQYRSEIKDVERRSEMFKNIFSEDDSHFRSIVPKVNHWSVAWSDLMMTMFILFLAMFVYQAAHKEFLVSDEVEILGGDTTDAVELIDESRAAYPFVPIKPGAPLVTSGTVKKVERLDVREIDPDTAFFDSSDEDQMARIERSLEPPVTFMDEKKQPAQPQETDQRVAGIAPSGPVSPEEIRQPQPLTGGNGDVSALDLDEMFSKTVETLINHDLAKFASIDIVPEKSIRLVLAGDILFDEGRAELLNKAKNPLEKIAATIKNTPYMINVVGHTDNIPMSSARYATNWELSGARASAVGRFLIEEIGMNPNQFLMSGFASYRPVKPNVNTANRAANRRVEIIISKRLAQPAQGSSEN